MSYSSAISAKTESCHRPSEVLHEADVLVISQKDANRSRVVRVDDPQSKSAFLVIEAKYWTKAVKLGTGREFLGLRRDSSAKAQAFVCTGAKSSAIAHLAASPGVEYDDGVLPAIAGEQSRRSYVHRLLRDYRDRQSTPIVASYLMGAGLRDVLFSARPAHHPFAGTLDSPST